MTWPPLSLSGIRTVRSAEVQGGRIVVVERSREWLVGITASQGDTRLVLLNDPQGRATAMELAQLRMDRVVDLGAANELVLTVDKDDGEARRWDSMVGCIGLTRHGLVLCVSGARAEFGGFVPVCIAMETGWTVLDDVRDLAHHGDWFTRWRLSMRDADEDLHRIVGNPEWPARDRQGR